MSLKCTNCHFNGASSELYVAMVFDDKVWMLPYKDTEGHKSMSFSIFSGNSKSSKNLSEHTFEIFAEKINGYD